VTSAVKGEGKSTTSINIVYAISQEFAKKVVLVECDFKKPSFMTYIPDAANKSGIIDVLQGISTIDDAIFQIEDTNISILPALRAEKKSIQLLGSPEFTKILDTLKEKFEYVILDTPPILSLADMNIISKKVDGILLVIKAGRTSKDIVLKAASSINGNISGLIFNGVDAIISRDYYNYYG
jgi:capsular exopolysaccharide synthesis family protein